SVNGGTLLYIGASGAASTETVATLNILANASSTVISQVGAGAGSSVALSFGQLNRSPLGFVQFVGAGVNLGAGNQILFTTAPTEIGSGTNAILPYATAVSSTGQVDLATLAAGALVAFTNYATGNINSAAAGSVYLLDGNLSPSPQTLTTSKSFNAVLIRGSGLALSGIAGVTLNLASGALLSAGGSGNVVSVPTLDFGAVEGVIDTAADLSISSTITGTSPIGITKAGPGTLTLSGTSPNTYSGQTIVTQGVLNVQKSGALGATVANDVQTVTISNAVGGTFWLFFNGQETASMAYNASAATVQTDLDALSTIGGVGGSVTVSDPNSSGNPNVYTITFGGSLAGIAQPGFGNTYSLSYSVVVPSLVIATVNPGGLAGAGTTVVSGAALQISGSSTETGEQLALNGTGLASTGALHADNGTNAWNGPVVLSTAATVNVDSGGQLAIGDAISGAAGFTKVGAGTLQFSGVNPNTLTGTTTVNDGTLLLDKTGGVTAINGPLTVGNDVGPGSDLVQVATPEQINSNSTVTMNSTGVLQLLASVATSTTQAEQTVSAAGSSGTFTLTFNSQTTANIPFNATTATVQSDLQSLSSIGGIGGSVSVTGTPGAYVVLFGGSLAGTAESAMTIAKTAGIGTASVQVISTGGVVGSQTIAGLSTQVGIAASSSVALASGTTLAFSGTVTVNSGVVGASSASPSVTISGGSLSLAAQGTNGIRSFQVNDSPVWVDLLVTSTITNGIAGGASGFSKAGTGRMVLDPTSGSNTFSGAVTVSSGELNLQQSGALAAASGTTVSSSAALEIMTSITTSGTLALNGTGVNNTGALLDVDVNGNDTWNGNVTVSTASNVGVVSGTTLTINGVIGGAFGLTKILPGTLVFGGSSANTNTGTTTVSEGTLLLSKPAGVDAIAAGGLLAVGNDAGGPDSDLVQLTAANEIDPAASVTIDSTGQLELNGFNQALAGVTMEFGPTQSALVTTESGTLSLTSSATFSSVGTLYTGSPAATISGNLALGSNSVTVTVNGGTSLDNAQISATITGSGTVTKSGSGTLLLSANNTAGWSSPITLSGGTVALGNSGGLGTGTLTVSASTTLRGEGTAITLANNITMNNPFTIGGTQNFALSGTVTGNSSSSYVITVANAGSTSLGNIVTPTAALTLFVNPNFYSNATLAGSVTGSGNFTKGGAGRLTVGAGGSINLSTNIFVTAGVLAVSNGSALGTANVQPSNGGALEISGNQQFNNELVLYNSSTTSPNSGSDGFLTGALRSTSGTNTWAGSVLLSGSSAGTNFIGVDSGQLTITGTVSEFTTGSGLAKVGAGTLVLGGSSSNTFTGLTTIDQGRLQLNKSGAANAIGSGGVTVGDGGGGHDADVLQFGPAAGTAEILSTASVTVGNSGLLDMATYSASATLDSLTLLTAPISSADVQTGNGILSFGSNTYVGVDSAGSTDGTSPAATISGKLTLASSTVFTVDSSLVSSSSDDLVISATVSGSSSANLVLVGGGTLAFTAANNYSGPTIIRGSTLALSGSGTDPDTQMTIQTGGTLLVDNQSAGNVNNRLGSSVGIDLSGGTFSYLGAPGSASSESIGELQVAGSDGVVASTVSTTPGSTVTITASSIYEAGTEGIFRFAGIGADLGSPSNQLLFSMTPTLIGGIIPDAVLEDSAGLDFAGYGASGIAPASYVTSLAGASPASNVKLSTGQTLSTSESVNAIIFVAPNVSVNLGTNTLTVTSGALATEATGVVILGGVGGTLALAQEGVIDAESGDDLTIDSSVTGSAGLLKTGTGTLSLAGNNTYAEGTWVNAGVLNVQSELGLSGNTTTVQSGAGLELQGNIFVYGSLVLAGTGPGNNGAGALRSVSGTNTWVGTVTSSAGADVGVTSGQLIFGGQVTSGALVQVGSGILQIAGSIANTSLNLTVDSGTLHLNDSAGSAINGNLKVGDGVGGSGAAQVVMMQASQFSSNSSITVLNSGTVDLAGYSQTFSYVSINDGSLTNSGSGGTLTLDAAVYPLSFVGGSLNTGTGTLVLAAAGPIAVNEADQTVISGNLSLPSGTTTFSVADGPSLDDLVINATITGSGSISKTGLGTMLLSGNNNYSGGTTMSGGTLAVGNASAVGSGTLTLSAGTLRGDGGNVSLANAVSMASAFTLGGRGDTSGTNTGIDLTGPVTETGSSVITVDDPAVLAEIAGAITQSVSAKAITKLGDGTLILAGNNGYSGGTIVSAGIVNVQNSSALGTGPVTVSSGAAVQTQGNLSIGNLALTLSGSGFVGNLFGTGEGTGAIENVSGTSTWGTGTTAITISGTPTSLGSDAGSLALDGTIGGSGFAVNKVGLGTIQLAGTVANSLTGTMTVNDGILQLKKTSGIDAIEGNLIIG
ncbi:MAG TPA: autotransporter-associated beta strand repeat-containing protein, partial [Pirellulales bacterium]